MCPKAKGTLEVGIGIGSGHGNSKSAFDRLLKVSEVSEAIGKAGCSAGTRASYPYA